MFSPAECLRIVMRAGGHDVSPAEGTHTEEDPLQRCLMLAAVARSNGDGRCQRGRDGSNGTPVDDAAAQLAAVYAKQAFACGEDMRRQMRRNRIHRTAELMEDAKLIEVATATSVQACGDDVHSVGTMPWHAFYKARCEALGVRSQRGVIDALARFEAAETSVTRASVSPGPPNHEATTASHGAAPDPCPSSHRRDTAAYPPPNDDVRPPTPSGDQGPAAPNASLDFALTLLGKRGFVPVLDTLEYMARRDPIRPRLRKQQLPLTLVLANCGLTDCCAECLGALLMESHPQLERLVLTGNAGIGSRGGNALLAYASAPWCRIASIDLGGTAVRPATVRTIETALARKMPPVPLQ